MFLKLSSLPSKLPPALAKKSLVLGDSVERFQAAPMTPIDPEFFQHLLWIKKTRRPGNEATRSTISLKACHYIVVDSVLWDEVHGDEPSFRKHIEIEHIDGKLYFMSFRHRFSSFGGTEARSTNR
jgi:hypothetical protein